MQAINNTRRVPAYTLHKPTGQGRVRIGGKDHYLGAYNSAESLRSYDDLIAVYLRDRSVEGHVMTVDELAVKYIAWAEQRYRKHGEPTGRHIQIAKAMKPLCRMFGRLQACDLGPRKLKEFRASLVAKGLKRSTVNAYIRMIVCAFEWAVSEEFISESVHRSLATVRPLRRGEGKDSKRVHPVSIEDVEATERFLRAEVRGLVRFQLYTAARPGEARIIRPCDIDMSGDVWKYIPERHKTEHHGKRRVIYIGPRGQAVLREFAPEHDDAYYFPPNAANFNSGEHYSVGGYATALRTACDAAKVSRWHPNQLRHTAATFIRKEFDVETARIILGHGSLQMTEIYAERDEGLALQAMQVIG